MEVNFRTKGLPVSNPQSQVEQAWSIGEQLSKDLEFYADLGEVRRSSPFRGLAWFWGSIIGAAGIGAIALQFLGSPTQNGRGFEVARARSTATDVPSELARPPEARFRDTAPKIDGAAETRQAALAALRPSALHTISEPEMITLPGATFRMGSNEDRSERPVHPVLVEPFLLAKTAVTVRQWQECVEARVCTTSPKGRLDQPVTNVSWDDARQFVSWLAGVTKKQFRLPTEAEWEYAARAGTDTRYSWGNAVVPGKASCKGCGEPVSMQNPPATEAYPPNPFGLFGMGGGVAEWVADCWHQDYQDAPRAASVAWDAPDCRERVLRGGSWVADASSLRPASRDYYDTAVRYPTHGFRVARTE